jgi:hypothetical protein
MEVIMIKWTHITAISLSILSIPTLLAACNFPPPQLPEAEVENNIEGEDAPTLRPDADRDSCLDGTWVMPTDSLDLLMSTMVPAPGLRITTGSLNMSFVEGTFSYSGDFVIQIDLGPGQYMEADSRFSTGGAYATEGNVTLIFDITASESEALNWTAYSNGQVVTEPGIGPTFTLNPPGEAPYRCTSNTLEIDTREPSGGTVTMFFQR